MADRRTAKLGVRRGIVQFRGLVPTVDDAEHAEAVATRVPSVVEVRADPEVA